MNTITGEQIGSVTLLRARIYPLTPGQDTTDIDTETAVIPAGTYPVFRDGEHYWWTVTGTVNQRGVTNLGGGVCELHPGDQPSDTPVEVDSERFDRVRFAQLLTHPVCRDGAPEQALRFSLQPNTGPPPTDAYPELDAAANQAWDAAYRHVQAHTQARHALAAALLRSRWPTATQVTADLTSQISADERGNPSLSAVRETAGALLAGLDTTDELTDAIEEQLGRAFDYADSPEAAGWEPVRDGTRRGLFDPILYTLDLSAEQNPLEVSR